MMNSKSAFQRVLMVGLLVGWGLAGNAYADDISDANETVALFKKTDPNLARFFKSCWPPGQRPTRITSGAWRSLPPPKAG